MSDPLHHIKSDIGNALSIVFIHEKIHFIIQLCISIIPLCLLLCPSMALIHHPIDNNKR